MRTHSTVLALMVCGSLLAEVPWTSVQGPRAAKDLVYRIVNSAKGPMIEFRNDGAQRLHFSFRFQVYQSKERGAFNGRIHQSPGAPPSRLPLPVVEGVDASALEAVRVKVYRVTTGPADAGKAEEDDD